MLRSLIAYAIRLSIVLTLFAGAVIFIGLQQPPSEWVQLLHLDDCELPCWIGIEPGKTTFAEARQKIDAIYSNTSLYLLEDYGGDELRITDKHTSDGMDILLSSDGETTLQPIVTNITLSTYIQPNGLPIPPMIGDLWNDLGIPESISRLVGSKESILIMSYQHQQTLVYISDSNECNRVSPNQQFGGISLGDQSNQPANIFGGLSSPLSWRGFYKCNDFGN
ncbi:MAG: hypothetical protein GC204_02750 [Chloroflexi bacterium]|nr:hypothetical protein [Chloroflexota bacterium]